MESFYEKLIAKTDMMVDEVLNVYGKRLPGYVTDVWADGVHWGAGNQVRPNNMIPYLYTSEWKCWPLCHGDASIGGGSTTNRILPRA
jgi:hypothetical protein